MIRIVSCSINVNIFAFVCLWTRTNHTFSMNEPTARRKASSERTVIWSWRCMSSACNSSICIWLGTPLLTCRGRGGLWGFFSFGNFFSDNTRVRIFIFVVSQSAKFCFQNLTLRYMTKTLNQIIFFSSTKIRIFFQEHWESEYFF
jgi:hypothetical protein